MIRGKHDPAGRREHIETAVLDPFEPLAIAHAILDLEPGRARPLPRLLDQGRRQIHAGHLCAGSRRAFRHRTGAAGEIEPAFPGLRLQALQEQIMEISQSLSHALIWARAPHHALALLQFFKGHAAG